MSNLNRWDYSGLSEACFSNPDQASYKKSAEFLGDEVEDWGCGTCWSKRYFKKYRGIDASTSGYEDEIVDLVNYTSKVKNILMRLVLEYNEDWRKILENVKKSFEKKFCLIISTPFVKKTKVGFYNPIVRANGSHGSGMIPEMYFNKKDILDMFPTDRYKLREETIKTPGHLYGKDWILYVEKI